jgi:hypothetical protein
VVYYILVVTSKCINVDGKQVIVKFMDDSWIINQCAGAHPFKPKQGVVWKPSDKCARLPIPGDEFPMFMSEVHHTYGNCAAIAWYGDMVLGHIVFLPRQTARQKRATGWEHFGLDDEDAKTLVVINLAFCSLSGHEFRRKGIGKAMVSLMVEWATEADYNAIEVYDTEPGLFPAEWLDHCIPPKPFWEARGFKVFAEHHNNDYFSEDNLNAIEADNPRDSSEEQRHKEQIISRIRSRDIDIASYSFKYDLRFTLKIK